MSHRREEKDAKKEQRMPNGHDLKCRCTDCRLIRCEITHLQAAKAYKDLAQLIMQVKVQVDKMSAPIEEVKKEEEKTDACP